MIRSNYDPSAAVYAFYPNAMPQTCALWWMTTLGVVLVIGLLSVVVARKRKQGKNVVPDVVVGEEIPAGVKPSLGDKLKALMEEKQLFKNKDLRAADVAAELGTNTTYLSACLNGELNTTFPAFVTGYRIRYAQELMRQDPTMRLSKVAEASGFTNEKTFLRSFKAACGVTPSEWKQRGE